MTADAVLLLHGLWLNRTAMLLLARRLRLAGFAPRTLSYASVRGGLGDHVERVARAVAAMDAPRVHFVAHSMGGIVLMKFLADARDARLGRAVLLGAPVTGSRAGRTLAQHPTWQRLLGESAHLWRDVPRPRIPAGMQIGAIAGTRRIGLGRFFVRLPGPNDGIVTVEETRLPGLAAHLVMPVSHTVMLIAPAVARETAHFLHHGRFAREG